MHNKSLMSKNFKNFIIALFVLIEIIGVAYAYFCYSNKKTEIIKHHQELNLPNSKLETKLLENKINSLYTLATFTLIILISGFLSNLVYNKQFKNIQKSIDDFLILLKDSIKEHKPLKLDNHLDFQEFVYLSNSLNKILTEIYELENYNSLTNFPKRNKFLHDITILKAVSNRHIIICYIHFRRYEQIIVNKGFDIADKIVLEFANEIKKINQALANSKIGKISRNGDFLFSFECTVTPSYCIEVVSNKLHDAFKNAMKINEENIYEQNIGLGFDILQNGDKADHEEAINNAYRAALLVSEQKDKLYFTYSKELREKIQYGVDLEQDLKKAIENNVLEVYFQGKISASNDKLKGAEALVRWKRNNKFENTEVFIKIAEKTDMIIKLEQLVIEKVLKVQRNLQDKNIFFPISINISAKHLASPGFLDFLNTKLNEYGILPKYIEIEIIERDKINEENISILQNIKNDGYSIAIDDFGKDYSSLSYIGNLPIDCIKIDKSFVDRLEKDEQENATAIIGGIIKIAKSINKTVVAEGVETLNQLEQLKALGCDQFQGYYFHKGASPIDEFLEIYKNRL